MNKDRMASGRQSSGRNPGRVGWLVGFLAALGVAGCTASADLKPGGAAEARSQYRFDQFQGAADNGKVLVVVGSNGIILSSADRGRSWARQEIGQRVALVGVTACPDGSFAALDFFRQAWIADAQGAGWQAKSFPTPDRPLAITCDARNRLWVVGSGSAIAMSSDRGANWSSQTVGEDVMLASIQFVDDERGFITGEFGTVLASTDAGASWTPRTQIGADFYPYAAHFADASRGWVSGLAGVVMHTEDGGKTWQKKVNPLGAPIYGLAVDAGGPVGVGINGLAFRYQGEQWTFSGVRPGSYLRAVLPLADGKVLLAGGAGAVEVTTLAAGAAPAAAN